jgi:chemotaxis response regulator CheB
MRIGVVSNVPRTIAALRRTIATNANDQLCWVASAGREAVRFCRSDPPDVLLVDVVLTDLTAAEVTQQVREITPCAVVVVANNIAQSASAVYAAMGRGAVDAADLPVLVGDELKNDTNLREKLATLQRLYGVRQTVAVPTRAPRTRGTPLVAIGSSTGGPQVLASILSALPKTFPAAVVIVQHFDYYFVSDLVTWLAGQTTLEVRAIEEGMALQPGVVYVASTNDHLVLREDSHLGYTPEPKEMPYRPSVDVFFSSIHRNWEEPGVAVLLTGMGRDGAAGLKQLRLDGWHTIAQDESSSAVYGMPKAAAACGAAIEILPSGQIASAIVAHLGK